MSVGGVDRRFRDASIEKYTATVECLEIGLVG
jgi:hypothetical protein